ncbi:hypothetical protein [Thiosulfatihalobacter marinus]|uniref:hypothetical protein n=1 Tax=Thiosulfatihalobacter marinus TaxID=2792481 RepID=UPI0018D70831|nr:hypothetical protein [Thiosulfatihalobacter marinus]
MAQNQTYEREPTEKQRDKPRLDKLPFLFISPGIRKKTRTDTQYFRSPPSNKPEKGENEYQTNSRLWVMPSHDRGNYYGNDKPQPVFLNKPIKIFFSASSVFLSDKIHAT